MLSRFDYSYDSRGRRIGMGTLDGAWTYTYDDIGQLTHGVFASTNPAIPDQDLLYVYDAMGNRIRTVENGVTTAYTTNNLNQYTQVGNTTYAFDADGNLISETSPSGTVLYSYDDENRLIAVQQGADAWAYSYDAFSQRVATSHNGVVTRYTIDPVGLGNVVGEYDAVGSLIAGYDYGFGLLSQNTSGTTAWYTFDAIGSSDALTGSIGNVLGTYSYTPFGSIAYQSGAIQNPFRFVAEFGVRSEAGGSIYMRARYYQTETGRFTQADPIGILSGSVNSYSYAENGPTDAIDPLGLEKSYVTGIPGIPRKYFRINYDFFSDKRLGLGSQMGRILRVDFGKFHLLAERKLIGKVAARWVPIIAPITAGWGIGETAGNLMYDLLNPEDAGNWVDWLGGPMFPGIPKPPDVPGPGGGWGIPGSVDPNQKLGPAGFGTASYISSSITLPYRIDFENDPTATAPAQIVTITDQLDPDLDWSTFALTEIGFGDHLIAIPASAPHFETTVPVHYNGQDFDVQIEAGINLATGQVYAHFYSIDPDTSLPPDVLTGFLPPEDGTGRGMGHVSYLIDPKPGLATGTQIRNIALISFDGQPWIATNQIDPHNPAAGTDPAKDALNTIDAGAPTSAVQPLPPTRTRPDFLVQWTAADDAGGSGVASHDIYVATDGGSYVLWKDDITATSATFTGQAGHSYAFYSVAQDHVGNTEVAPATPDATTQVVDGLAVTAVATDASGAAIRFNRPFDPVTLNLYATETGGQGPADVTLVGATTGAVTGSLVLDDDLQGFRFVRTGGPLAPDTYTLTLRSAANGVIDTLGRLLDGDDDGTPGGDSVTTLTVAGPLPRVLSLPDVVRGPGQPVNIPATVSGIPIRLSDGSGVESLEFTLNYDPTLLTISDSTLAAGLPAGSTLVANLTVAGQLRVAMSFPTPLAAGAQDLLTLTAAVPATAPYRAKQVLDLADVSINEGALAAVADDAVHLVAHFGDTTGNGSYSSLDGQRVLRQAVGLDSGFAAYPLADPVLVADITGNGAVSSLDATRIIQEAVGIDRPEIPPLPVPALPITPAGADPYVHIPTNLSGIPGSVITVPVLIDDAVGLEAADLRLVYDPALLEVVAVRAGLVTTGATIVTNPTPADSATGALTVGLALTTPRPAGGGSLLEIDFRIRPTATSGATALNLTRVSLNEDGLVLTPQPVPGPDGSDGLLTILGAGNRAPIAAPDDYATDEDTPLTIVAPGVLGNDSDVDGDPLTASLVNGPAHGTLSLDPDGSFVYRPSADYSGPDSFRYQSFGGVEPSTIAVVSLNVNPVNDAPTLDPPASLIVDEGTLLEFRILASDVENDALTFSLDAAPVGATIDADTGLFAWTAADGPATSQVVVRVTDALGAFSTGAFEILVRDVAPTLLLSGEASVAAGQPYTLGLSVSDPGADSVTEWRVNWGDGNAERISGDRSVATHTYAATGAFTVTAVASDEDGSYPANALDVWVTEPETLRVSAFTPTASGFHARFNRAIDAPALNLYDSENAGLGAPDVTLVGTATGAVRGSLIVDADGAGISLIRSGGPLPADDYTVRLGSGAMAVHDLAGRALDGDADGLAGDAFESSFTAADAGLTVSLPDVVRGPGQPADLGAPSLGGALPVWLSDGSGVTEVEFSLRYDPAILDVQGVSAGAQLPAGTTIERLAAPAGLLSVRLTSPTELAAGRLRLLDIAARVPDSAAYGAKQVLDLEDVRVNGRSGTGDDALQLVAYLGDTSGDASYGTLDAQKVQRVLVRLDSGFAAYPNVDPLLVADVNASGTLTSIDASRLLQEVGYLSGASSTDRLEIPPIPAGVGPLQFAGPDPLVDIAVQASGEPGEVVTVPVRIDTAAGLESVQLTVAYDASRFELVGVRRGSLAGDFAWFVAGSEAGRITVDMARLDALAGGSGNLLEIDLRIRDDAAPGIAAIDLQYARLNDGHLTLGVSPQAGLDATDGQVTVGSARAERFPAIGSGDAALSASRSGPASATVAAGAAASARKTPTLGGAALPGAVWPAPAALAEVPAIPSGDDGRMAVSPVVDLAGHFDAPAAVSASIADEVRNKPWLRDYLGNGGETGKGAAKPAFRVKLPVVPVTRPPVTTAIL
ncbi:cohesin domain-containing protein [Accumulibacter sp.]|uniref:cohesin domain-containing protein n=1 Tax=Accumulibacter sp. TaxID=2053492 RepID=UPI0025FE74B4|nr:cohesin domain-containing protein [Accumulibacter sp.]MCM8594071.1 cohesin domain-containing protein [Accumulibacter sp.]MCM8624479.1 cohesin domain-containing protein [Accumulibacter sp.]MDS4048215.1 cohesin domain-containing protein [Accumulibacter sp.]